MNIEIEIQIILEEYRSLRSEITQSMSNGNNIMAFGLATIGVVLHAALSVKSSLMPYWILLLVIPLLSYFILSMWFSEQQRISRASHYLTRLEVKIAKKTNIHGLLEWEHWLRNTVNDKGRKNRHFLSSEYSGIAIFVLLICTTPLMTFSLQRTPLLIQHITLVSFAYLLLISLFISFLKRVVKWRKELEESALDN